MKKSFMSISMLVVSISMLALFLCSSAINAQASSKFIYDKSENSETVYTLDKSGKYLKQKLKYEYKILHIPVGHLVGINIITIERIH